ncbi:hypothetical protein GDO78_022892 [Eleutherodactylus coqui]|uniref:FAS-associated death domain protein n=1 Tax=Eleutherodactylus coqui TaxID=57060 RepID=A0A8J6EPI3_ELECQ|nr:hypothetical protein GDO78_022892 [Eleutherodactylus coqui]
MEKVDKLNAMLLQISGKLDNKELEDLKFLCQNKIVKKKMELISSPIHLFRQLKELLEISEEDLSFLVELLDTINRHDLAQEVEKFRGPQSRVQMRERDQLDQAFDIICENVGKDWKKLIRILGIADATMDQVIYENPNNMQEQLRQCLNKWREKKKEGATVSALVQGLENCRMRLVSERLADSINLSHGTS